MGLAGLSFEEAISNPPIFHQKSRRASWLAFLEAVGLEKFLLERVEIEEELELFQR
jgi:hypothetical protein